jgi:hypothetical protein
LVCWLLAMNNDPNLPAVQLSPAQSVEYELMRDASASCCEDAEVDWRRFMHGCSSLSLERRRNLLLGTLITLVYHIRLTNWIRLIVLALRLLSIQPVGLSSHFQKFSFPPE